MNSSITVIGGADGPTSIFLSGSIIPAIIASIAIITAVISAIILINNRKK